MFEKERREAGRGMFAIHIRHHRHAVGMLPEAERKFRSSTSVEETVQGIRHLPNVLPSPHPSPH